ncbi:MAG TPA: hypothetical protein VHS36_02805, partial [Candidatus Limnocylindrales bacterium]|nr:hypothetical protein [Candidatus Limnocylindrales bacterium]
GHPGVLARELLPKAGAAKPTAADAEDDFWADDDDDEDPEEEEEEDEGEEESIDEPKPAD